MSGRSRTARSVRNVAVGAGTQVLLVALSFATRTVFVSQLGAEMLGVNALLVSILAVLAVADLGINGAVMYALYSPLASEETDRIASVVAYAARLYRRVALVVAIVGLGVLPFLDELVNLDDEIPLLHVYYLILLLNAVVGYLLVHRVVLLNADQRMYLAKVYAGAFAAMRTVAQIAALMVLQSFLAFVLLQAAFTIANNAYAYRKVGQLYPYLRSTARPLEPEARSSIRHSVRAMLVYRVGGIVLNSTDAILVSVIVGTLALGYYSNYLLIVGSIVMIAEVAFSALSPGVGSLLAAGEQSRGRLVLSEIALLALFVYGTLSVGLLVSMDDFIRLWLGEDFVLDRAVAVAVVINFYLVGMQAPIWAFRGATGMFRETQYAFVVTAVLNLGLSIALGVTFGIAGIVAATVAARLITVVWYEPWVLLRRHLGGHPGHYLAWQLGAFGLTGASYCLVEVVTHQLGASALALAGRLAVVAGIVPGILWLTYGRSDAFASLVKRGRLIMAGTSRGASSNG